MKRLQIRINLKIFIFILLFYLSKQIEIYSIIMIFACIHELGHILAGILLGFKPQKIELMPLGLAVSFKVDTKNYNKKIERANLLSLKKILIAVAGPLTNFILAIIFYKIKFSIPYNIQEQIIYTNILIGIFNLLPIYPMDGGRILKETIHIKKGLKKSIIYTNQIANISIIIITAISSIAIYYLKNIAILFILAYLWILIIMENRRYKIRKRIYEIVDNNRIKELN